MNVFIVAVALCNVSPLDSDFSFSEVVVLELNRVDPPINGLGFRVRPRMWLLVAYEEISDGAWYRWASVASTQVDERVRWFAGNKQVIIRVGNKFVKISYWKWQEVWTRYNRWEKFRDWRRRGGFDEL